MIYLCQKIAINMKKLLNYALVGSFLFVFAGCDNAAKKIKSEEEKVETSPVESTVGNQSASNNQRLDPEVVSQEGQPVFSFETERHDFGTISEGTVARHDFVFTNTGDAPLIITNASGSCGCTVPTWPREPIAPGEQGTIKVEFNSTNRTGAQTKQVTLTANTVPNKKILRIQAQVEAKEGEEEPAS